MPVLLLSRMPQRDWHLKQFFWPKKIMRHKHRRRSTKAKLLPLFVVLVSILSVYLILRIPVIKKITISGGAECIGDSKPAQINSLAGQNILFADKKKVEDEIKKKFICIKGIKLNKIFPDQVNVGFIAREPKIEVVVIERAATTSAEIADLEAYVSSPSSELKLENFPRKGTFLTDEDGIVFSSEDKESLSKIYSFSNFALGQKIAHDSIGKILKIIGKLKEMGMDTSTSLLQSDQTYLMYSNPKVYFNLESNLDFQIASLQLILNKSKIIRDDVVFIDLRYDKPIVKFAPKK